MQVVISWICENKKEFPVQIRGNSFCNYSNQNWNWIFEKGKYLTLRNMQITKIYNKFVVCCDDICFVFILNIISRKKVKREKNYPNIYTSYDYAQIDFCQWLSKFFLQNSSCHNYSKKLKLDIWRKKNWKVISQKKKEKNGARLTSLSVLRFLQKFNVYFSLKSYIILHYLQLVCK